jgi:predicted nuclease with TOPRIM domain
MQEQLQKRLEQLKEEFEAGQTRLRELETEQSFIRETMLRISGAVQVLEEALRENAKSDKPATPAASLSARTAKQRGRNKAG